MRKVRFGPEPTLFDLGWSGEKSKPGRLKHRGVMTVAVREEAPQVLVMGFAFCSPTDQFCYDTGRREALRRMNEWPLRFRYIGDPLRTLDEVTRALCCRDFDELGHFVGEHLDAVLFTKKPVERKLKGGSETEIVVEKVCRVPAWAKEWWVSRRMGGLLDMMKELKPPTPKIKVVKMSPKQFLDQLLAGKRPGEVQMNEAEELPLGVKLALDELIRDIRTGGMGRIG